MSIPTTFFIDREGKIESVLSGYHSLEELKAHSMGNIPMPAAPGEDATDTKP